MQSLKTTTQTTDIAGSLHAMTEQPPGFYSHTV